MKLLIEYTISHIGENVTLAFNVLMGLTIEFYNIKFPII